MSAVAMDFGPLPISTMASSDPTAAMRTMLVAIVTLFVAGCSTIHYHVNAPLERYDSERGYRLANFRAQEGAEDLLVVLAFSGGGTRASPLAYGALEEARAPRIRLAGQAQKAHRRGRTQSSRSLNSTASRSTR